MSFGPAFFFSDNTPRSIHAHQLFTEDKDFESKKYD